MYDTDYRAAQAADVDAVQACVERAYAVAFRMIDDLPDVTQDIAGDIARHATIVAEKSGTVVGVIIFDAVEDALMIFNLAVAPEARGSGVARRLMMFAEQHAKKHGLTRLRLRTHRHLSGAIAMYQHLGWVKQDVVGNSVTMGKDVMNT
ncbi:MAG: GNAT family N-acetyltransferase [Pseudomonadota bacterium]